MAQILRGLSSYSAELMVYLVVLLQTRVQPQDTTVGTASSPTTSHIWTPPTIQAIPFAPVNYEFGGERICLLLSTATTAVVLANVSDASQEFSVDISPGVAINLGQRMSSCEQNTDLMCIALIITTDSNNLTEGEFQAFYNGKVTRIEYGPLGLSNPSGSNILPFSPSNTMAELLLRPRTMNREEFRVCNNGSIADFIVSFLSRQPHCRLGSGAGGFSTPFQVRVTYIGDFPINGRHFIITSGSCEDPQADVAFSFTVFDHPTTPTPTASVTPTPSVAPTPTPSVTPTPTPSVSPTPTPSVTPTTAVSTPSSSINVTTMATPPAPASPIAIIASVVVAVVLFLAVVIGIAVVIIFIKKNNKKTYEVPSIEDRPDGGVENQANAPNSEVNFTIRTNNKTMEWSGTGILKSEENVHPKTVPLQRKGNPGPESLIIEDRGENSDCQDVSDSPKSNHSDRSKQRPDRTSASLNDLQKVTKMIGEVNMQFGEMKTSVEKFTKEVKTSVETSAREVKTTVETSAREMKTSVGEVKTSVGEVKTSVGEMKTSVGILESTSLDNQCKDELSEQDLDPELTESRAENNLPIHEGDELNNKNNREACNPCPAPQMNTTTPIKDATGKALYEDSKKGDRNMHKDNHKSKK